MGAKRRRGRGSGFHASTSFSPVFFAPVFVALPVTRHPKRKLRFFGGSVFAADTAGGSASPARWPGLSFSCEVRLVDVAEAEAEGPRDMEPREPAVRAEAEEESGGRARQTSLMSLSSKSRQVGMIVSRLSDQTRRTRSSRWKKEREG